MDENARSELSQAIKNHDDVKRLEELVAAGVASDVSLNGWAQAARLLKAMWFVAAR